jgi:hypothetical protein
MEKGAAKKKGWTHHVMIGRIDPDRSLVFLTTIDTSLKYDKFK